VPLSALQTPMTMSQDT